MQCWHSWNTATVSPNRTVCLFLLRYSCNVLYTRYFTPEVSCFHSGSCSTPLICPHILCVCVWYCLGQMTVREQNRCRNWLYHGRMRNFVIRALQPSLSWHKMCGTCSTHEDDVKDNVMFYAKFVRSSWQFWAKEGKLWYIICIFCKQICLKVV